MPRSSRRTVTRSFRPGIVTVFVCGCAPVVSPRRTKGTAKREARKMSRSERFFAFMVERYACFQHASESSTRHVRMVAQTDVGAGSDRQPYCSGRGNGGSKRESL